MHHQLLKGLEHAYRAETGKGRSIVCIYICCIYPAHLSSLQLLAGVRAILRGRDYRRKPAHRSHCREALTTCLPRPPPALCCTLGAGLQPNPAPSAAPDRAGVPQDDCAGSSTCPWCAGIGGWGFETAAKPILRLVAGDFTTR